MKILVTEDNSQLRTNLIFLLTKYQHCVEGAENGLVALEKSRQNNYDVIILDINMPIMDGKAFLKKFRWLWGKTPVIALTSDSMLRDKLEVFDLGVDDYMTKPFEIEELIARLHSIGRRRDQKLESSATIHGVQIDYTTHKIHDNGQEILFPRKQYMIIEFLSRRMGYPQNKIQIMEYVWGELEENLELDSTTLESHIYAIRKKLGKDFIKTLKGTGYIIE